MNIDVLILPHHIIYHIINILLFCSIHTYIHSRLVVNVEIYRNELLIKKNIKVYLWYVTDNK